MAAFDPATLDRWRALAIVDRDGTTVGTISEFYLDRETGYPTWALVNTGLFGATQTFIPLVHATEISDGLQVPYEKSHIKDTPRVDPHDELTPDEEATLFTHYGVDYQPSPGEAPPTGLGPGTGSPEPAPGSPEDPGAVPPEPGSVEGPGPVPAEPASVEGPGPVPSEPGSVEGPGPVPSEPGSAGDPSAVRTEPGSVEGLGPIPSEPGSAEDLRSVPLQARSGDYPGSVPAESGSTEGPGSAPSEAGSARGTRAGASEVGSVDDLRPGIDGVSGELGTGEPDDATLVAPGGLVSEYPTGTSRLDTSQDQRRDLGVDPTYVPPADPTLSRTAPVEPGLPGSTAAAPGPVPSTVDKDVAGDPTARPAEETYQAPDETAWPAPTPGSFDDHEPAERPMGASDRWREAKLAAERERIARASAAQHEERSPLERARRRLERLVGVGQDPSDDISPAERDAAERARRARLGYEDDDPHRR